MMTSAPLMDVPLLLGAGLPDNRYRVHQDVTRLIMSPGETGRSFLFAAEPDQTGIIVVRGRSLPQRIAAAGTSVQIPETGTRHYFRLIASPMKSLSDDRKGRLPFGDEEARLAWLAARSERAGFRLIGTPDVRWRTIRLRKRSANFTMEEAVYCGVLEVTDREALCRSMEHGIGRGKAYGFGLLRLFPVSCDGVSE